MRVDVDAAPGSAFDVGAAVDRVRDRFKSVFEPVLSPVHVLTNGQPNVMGNPRQALPQPSSDELAPRAGNAGEGITIAIIDSGIEPHHWLNGGYVALPTDFERTLTVEHNSRPVLGPQAGHGVFLAGLALQHAPGVTVKVVRTANSWGQSDVDDVAAAILRVAASGADIHLSLGAFTRNNRPPWALSRALDALPRENYRRRGRPGICRPSARFWPGAMPGVTAVGALAADDGGWRLADFTNYVHGSMRMCRRLSPPARTSATRVRPTTATSTGIRPLRRSSTTGGLRGQAPRWRRRSGAVLSRARPPSSA